MHYLVTCSAIFLLQVALFSVQLNANPRIVEDKSINPDSNELSHNAAVRFSYLDRAKSLMLQKNEGDASRAFGLTEARIDLKWKTVLSDLYLALRPDALIGCCDSNVKRTAFDSRAGEVYRPSRQISFLDEYEIAYKSIGGFSMRLGTWSALSIFRTSPVELIDFGLNSKFGENISGLALDWDTFKYDSKDSVDGAGLLAKLIFYQGRNDRSEMVGRSKDDLSPIPAAMDPYLAAALMLQYHAGRWDVDTVLGYSNDESKDSYVSETFFGLYGFYREVFGLERFGFVTDLKSSSEHWNRSKSSFPDLTQWSALFGLNIDVAKSDVAVVNFKYGSSQRHSQNDVVSFEGGVVELGYHKIYSHFTTFELGYNFEWRDKFDENRDRTDGFIRSDGTTSELQRIVFNLNYQI